MAPPAQRCTPRHTATSVAELVAGATERTPLAQSDGKSGAILERVVIDGDPFVLKLVDRRRDWIMRQMGDLAALPVVVWEAGLLDLVPDCVDHTLVGAARGADGTAVLMRDVGPSMVPSGDEPISEEQHQRFLEHLAACHVQAWGWKDDVGLVPLSNRYLFFSPAALEIELADAAPAPVVLIAADGWSKLATRSPTLAAAVEPLLREPWPLFDALGREPSTFSHGDWKLGNLGSHADGRTVLVDWSIPWSGPPCADLVHYIVLNNARLPVGCSKDDAVETYRRALRVLGVDTDPWWERQLGLCVLGAMLQLGWEKALSDDDELAWWTERATDALRWL